MVLVDCFSLPLHIPTKIPVLKSELLRELQKEIQPHDLSTFVDEQEP
jgi:hypothetical protein